MAAGTREQFLGFLRTAALGGELHRLTLSRYRGPDPTLRSVFARPVALKAGARLAVVWRFAARDETRNFAADEALALLEPLVGADFLDAHLFTARETVQLDCRADGAARLRRGPASMPAAPETAHDHAKERLIPADAPWLQALGVTGSAGKPREGMAPKFRQIEKFAEILESLLQEGGLEGPLRVIDMGCGKGYLTFAVSSLLGGRASVRGVEVRAELVELCNRIAAEHGFGPRLAFAAGTIADTPLDGADVVIALHACDTATDDALAHGVAAGARLLLVAPCCHKELRTQLAAPPVLAGALRHGIFQERHAEFATDALRAELLEWAGYRTKAFEFVSTEHTAKNLMIAALKSGAAGDAAAAERVRALASFYGIRRQAFASRLGFEL